jgi:hypothetical protein
MRRALLAAVAALLVAAPQAGAATLTVTGTADGSSPCDADQCLSIRSALAQAGEIPGADTIVVPAGDYPLASALAVSTDVTIRGAGASSTSVHGGTTFRVFDVASGVTATISYLTMAGGTATDVGGFFGGNLINRGTLVLDHIRATEGRAYSGGGLSNASGTMTVQYSLVDHNQAPDGGADSGGIQNFGTAGAPGTLTVRDSTVAFNAAGNTGGILSWGDAGNANVTTLERVTVAGNSANIGAGGIYRGDASETFTVRGSIVAGNRLGTTPSNCGAGILSGGGNLESGNDCAFAQPTDVQLTDPLLAPDLTDRRGETPVLPIPATSRAVGLAGDCTGSDQRDLARPQGVACDAGAYEAPLAVVQIDSAPPPSTRVDPRFTFSSTESNSFRCTWVRDGVTLEQGACTSPETYGDAEDGDWTFSVEALDQQGQPLGAPATRAFRVDTAAPAAPVIASPATGRATITLRGTAEPGSAVSVSDGDRAAGSTVAREDGAWSLDVAGLSEGRHDFTAVATDAAGNSSSPSEEHVVEIDLTAPSPPAVTSQAVTGGTASFTFSSPDADATFECRLDGPSGAGTFAACTSPKTFSGLAAGEYAFVVRAVDPAGNVTEAAPSPFAVAAVAAATPTPTPTPRPRPTPTFHETVVVRPISGTILVRKPGSTEYVELDATEGIPLGSTVDVKHGVVELSSVSKRGGKPEKARFSEGIFKVTQPGTTTDLTLNEPLAACKKATAAAKKPKTRKLWGDGSGSFRTRGQYSAATVRGTKWLVQDSCAGTLIKVVKGVVAVRDNVKRKTIILRGGKQYLAQPKKH